MPEKLFSLVIKVMSNRKTNRFPRSEQSVRGVRREELLKFHQAAGDSCCR